MKINLLFQIIETTMNAGWDWHDMRLNSNKDDFLLEKGQGENEGMEDSKED